MLSLVKSFILTVNLPFIRSVIFFSILTVFSLYKSIPVKFLPRDTQAIPVVPLPAKGSRTQSPLIVVNLMILATKSSGNIAKCSFP
jgi:hypothetical protein